MFDINYITRNNRRPNSSMQFIYFCSHKDDFDKYFNEISKDIVNSFNCAVFYNAGTSAHTEEELREFFSQISLVIVPVTLTFLETDNIARTQELRYAIENNIHIIPIIEEDGLETRFNSVVAHLHTISKYCNYTDGLSYEERLKKHLGQFVITDLNTALIENEFSGSFFLSYRKKDRKFAIELINLIHSNQNLRDFSIWFDDYLIPGENFDDAIADAIEKSDIFALTVTDNLWNEDNYVTRQELPLAQELKKNLFCVDFNTSPKYQKNIPDSIKATDKSAILQSLDSILAHFKTKEKTPKHNYLIALAYLYGISVEKNTEYALELLNEAARASFYPAMKELVSVYRHGIGLESDRNGALLYQNRILYHLEQNLSDYTKEYFEETMTLYELSKEIGNDFYALRQIEKAISIYEDYATTDDTYSTYIGQLHYLAGCILRDTDSDGAIEHLTKAKEIFEKGSSAFSAREEAIVYSNLGMLYLKQGYDNAKEYLETASQKLKELNSLYNSINSKRDYATSLSYLGEYYLESSPEKAKEYFEEFFQLMHDIAAQTRDADDLFGLSVACEKKGDLFLREASYEDSLYYYNVSFNMRSEIYESNDQYRYIKSLLVICNKIGGLFLEEKKTLQAYKAYERGYNLGFEWFEKNQNNQAIHIDLAILSEKLADALPNNEENKTLATQLYMNSIDFLMSMKETYIAETIIATIAKIYEKLAERNPDNKKTYLETALQLWTELSTSDISDMADAGKEKCIEIKIRLNTTD